MLVITLKPFMAWDCVILGTIFSQLFLPIQFCHGWHIASQSRNVGWQELEKKSGTLLLNMLTATRMLYAQTNKNSTMGAWLESYGTSRDG